MKVELQKDYKKFYTLMDVENAKKVIQFEKRDDEETVTGWAEYAVKEGLKFSDGVYIREIIRATAHTAKNARVHNAYGDTEDMDVWIEALAETSEGFIKVGAYLSDIWQSGAVAYWDKMYIKRYKEV